MLFNYTRKIWALGIVLSITFLCTMVNRGNGQFIDADKYKIDFKIKKESSNIGVKGEFESKEWDLKATGFGGVNYKDAFTGEGINLKFYLDIAWMGSIFFHLTTRFFDITGDSKSEGSADLTVKIYKEGSREATFRLYGSWDTDGNLIGPISAIELTEGNTASLGLSYDFQQQWLSFSFIKKWSPHQINGSIVFGNPLAPAFTGTVSGNLTTEAPIPTLSVDTSGEYAISEINPNEMILNVTSQTKKTVGGIAIPIDKFGLLVPYIGLVSTIVVATVATAIYVKRRKQKQ